MQRLSYKERLRETLREEIECLISTVFNLDEMKQRIADTLALSDHALIADTPARASVSANVMVARERVEQERVDTLSRGETHVSVH